MLADAGCGAVVMRPRTIDAQRRAGGEDRDIVLALDALEMAFTHSHINAFVIVGGDSDFMALVEKLKLYDRQVFVIGGRAFTSVILQKNCTEFTEEVGEPEQARSEMKGMSQALSGEMVTP